MTDPAAPSPEGTPETIPPALSERTEMWDGGACVSITPFPHLSSFTLTVRKGRELGSDQWRHAEFSTPMTQLRTVDDVTAYARALLLLAEIGAELDVEFPPPSHEGRPR